MIDQSATTPDRTLEPRSPAIPSARARRVPIPLAALLAATLIFGVAWAFVIPPFQAPDEPAHFAYVQSLAEASSFPQGVVGRPFLSTEMALAMSMSNADQAAAQPETKMEWSAEAARRWERSQAELPSSARGDGDGINPAASNPPSYYVLETVPYLLASNHDLFSRLAAARLASVLWLLVTVTAVWLLAGEVFGRDRLLQLAAASLAGLAPMMTFVSASVTPDAMLYATWSLAFWLGVRVLKKGITVRRVAAFFAIVGIGCTVKVTSYALLPGSIAVLALGFWRARPIRGSIVVITSAGALLGLALTLGVWLVLADEADRASSAQLSGVATTSGLNIRQLLSYVWQVYLPRTPMQTDVPFTGGVPPVYHVWFEGAVGRFGWLEVRFPGAVYVALGAASISVALAASVVLWRTRRTVNWAVAIFFVLVVGALLTGLHWQEYRQVSVGGQAFIQGRYLLPLVGLAGLILAQALRLVPVSGRHVVLAGAVSGLCVLQYGALYLILERFYV
jgi:4-amino-4-deoxy-L-arabinose transferase-like glycosyltransferase